jgi:DNA-binding MarR family transcriptional regulator
MIELLVQKKLLSRALHPSDRRRFAVSLTADAEFLLVAIQPLIDKSRKKALNGIDKQQADGLQRLLSRIIKNCIG